MEIKIYKQRPDDYSAPIGDLNYGTLVTGVVGHADVPYIKVNKRKLGMDIKMHVPDGVSVLMNLHLGTLRQIPGDTIVKTYRGKLDMFIDKARKFTKDQLY